MLPFLRARRSRLAPVLFGGLLLAAAGCESDKDPAPPAALGGGGKNVFVLNEGNFGQGNASISYFNKESKALTADIFQQANGRSIGDVVQHLGVRGNRGYAVVNNSGRIEVVNLPDFKSVATISGLTQPRYFVSTSANRGYVTEWRGNFSSGYQPGRVTVLNLADNTVVTSLTVGRNPEQLVAAGGSVFVPNLLDNTLSVVNDGAGTLAGTVTVGDAPESMVVDKNGNVWVLCKGFVRYNATAPFVTQLSAGTLIRFSPNAPTQQFKLTFPLTGSPSQLRINKDGDQLYYSFNGAEYRLNISDTALPTQPLIRRDFYGFDVDPVDNTLYGATASFTRPDYFVRYRPDGSVVDSFQVGIGPNGFAFY